MESRATHRFAWTDLLGLLVTLTCFGFGVAAIAQPNLAIWLRQVNQLIVLGFVLAVMGIVTLKNCQTLLLLLQARFGSSTLQNYDGQPHHSPHTLSSLSLSMHATIYE